LPKVDTISKLEQWLMMMFTFQAMGIYLYGELVLSGEKAQRQIAQEAFYELADEMEKDTYVSVKEMIFGGSETSGSEDEKL
jgi:hypothetical protein